MSNALSLLLDEISSLEGEERQARIEEVKRKLHLLSFNSGQPINDVRWVPIEQVEPNDYNPNSVGAKELDLLYVSIWNDGYTQPVVTVYDEASGKFCIVDGFHRYYICKTRKDVRDRNHGLLPIVVLNKSINDRMASTVRHNRARGKHALDGMASMVFSMLDNGWEDAAICHELGMEEGELMRLKHVTGFSKLFENVEYKQAWMTKKQILIRKAYKDAQESLNSSEEK